MSEEQISNRLISKGVSPATAKKAAQMLTGANYGLNGMDTLLTSFAAWYKAYGSEMSLKALDEAIIK